MTYAFGSSARTAALLLSVSVTPLLVSSPSFAEPVAFSLAQQPLAEALRQFSRQSGLEVSASSDLMADRQGSAVSATMEPETALNRLLAGTGLGYRFVGQRSVVITAQIAQNGSDASEPISEDDDALVSDEILVQGELQTRTLQDTQTSVAVITGEELERRSDVSLRSVAERVAGVNTSARGIGFVIRGVDERGVDANGPSAPAITTSIDGARITDFGRINTTFLSTWDVEQIELLRGPQSTQSGRNALAGAVNIVSNDPSFEQEFKMRGLGGNAQTFQGAVAVNQPLIDDKLAMRISADFNQTNGFINNPTLGIADDGGNESLNLRGALRFEPTDDFSAILKLSYIEATDSFASSASQFFPSRIVVTDALTQDEMDYRTMQLRMSYDLSDNLSLGSETVFVDRRFVFSGDFDSSALPLASATDDSTGQSFSQEIKFEYEDDRFNGVLGGFFLMSDETSVGNGTILSTLVAPAALAPLLTPGSTVTGLNRTTREVQNFAVFGELEAEVYGGFSFIVGGRYDREVEDRTTDPQTTTNDPVLGPFLPADIPESSSTTFDAFLPKAGVKYDFNDDVSLGFTFQRGYRSGGSGTNLGGGIGGAFPTFEFDPEFTNNYELAFRSEWFDDRLTVNANAYYVQFRDQQVVVALSANPLDQETQNAGKSRSFGGELEIRAEPFDDLELYASIGYNETEFLDFISNGVQLAGNEFRNAPRWTGAIGGTYYFSGDTLDGFFVGADATFTSGSFNDAANTPALRSDPRFLLNLRGGYEWENFTISAFVDNLTDVTYAEERQLGAVTIGDPITFGLIGQVEF
ncbi:MAG: TonB-dependent receptor [Pseudomonadota bacterium]